MSLSTNQIIARVDKIEWLHSIFNKDTLTTYNLYLPELIIPELSTRLFYRFKILKSKLDKSEIAIKTYILMDVNPENNSIESTKKFIDIAKLLKDIGLNIPIIYSFDFHNGYLLVKDFGELTYYECFKRNLTNPLFNMIELYKNAINSLFKLQIYTREDILPSFNYERQLLIMNWFIEYYLLKHCKNKEYSNKSIDILKLSSIFQLILDNLKKQEKVFIHYDYH
jgi:aminoglycoside/choline kinase family phosphotransferase